MAKKKSVLSEELARKEVDKWLDFRKVSDEKRSILVGSITNLVLGLMTGDLILNEDFSLTQKLKWAIGEVAELKYKARLPMGEVRPRLLLVKKEDALGESMAYAAALTGQPFDLITKIDSEDYRLLDHISFFFMV